VLDEKKLEFEKVHTNENSAHMMAKILPKEKQGTCWWLTGMYIAS